MEITGFALEYVRQSLLNKLEGFSFSFVALLFRKIIFSYKKVTGECGGNNDVCQKDKQRTFHKIMHELDLLSLIFLFFQ